MLMWGMSANRLLSKCANSISLSIIKYYYGITIVHILADTDRLVMLQKKTVQCIVGSLYYSYPWHTCT